MERGENVMPLDEVHKMLKRRWDNKQAKVNHLKEDMLEKIKKAGSEAGDGKVVAPQLNQKDVKFLARGSEKYSQKEILMMHVKNWKDLDLK
jgi:hypothetical protein